MKHAPFFSIAIPTFNRTDTLQLAIQYILAQTFHDYEIVISDNNSVSKTVAMIQAFRDKRIRYHKNRKNIGAIRNIEKAFTYAAGQYVVLHGDDDFMVDPSLLMKVYEKLKRGNYGYIRINYKSIIDKKYVFSPREHGKSFSIRKGMKNKDIVSFIEKTDPYFITGIIFKNNLPKNIHMIHSELAPWFPILFYNVKESGGYFMSQQSFIGTWSTWAAKNGANHPLYGVINDSLHYEAYLVAICSVLDEAEYQRFVHTLLVMHIKQLPAGKIHLTNSDIMLYARKVSTIDPALRRVPEFWMYVVISLLSPRWVLIIMRHLYLRRFPPVANNHEEKGTMYSLA